MTQGLTDSDIELLREGARAASDWNQVALCNLALGVSLFSVHRIGGREWTREAAREECVRVMALVAAMLRQRKSARLQPFKTRVGAEIFAKRKTVGSETVVVETEGGFAVRDSHVDLHGNPFEIYYGTRGSFQVRR